MPRDDASRLLMIAMPQEAAVLLGEMQPQQLKPPGGHFSAYRLGKLIIGVSGIGGPNMAALASLLLSRHPGIGSVANFGSAGAYAEAGIENGSVLCVSSVAKWDLHLPMDGYADQIGPENLDTSIPQQAGYPCVPCNSGCSFSEESGRRRKGFPAAQLEDMELYSLAVLCRAHGLPLWSMKFVSNQVGEDAASEFEAGFSTHLRQATGHLATVLDTLQ